MNDFIASENKNISKKIHPLVSLSIIVLLSLLVAVVLFGVLSSTGIFKNSFAEFSGAAAGFFSALYLLHRWYVRMEANYEEIIELKKTLRKMQIPDFEIPPNFTPYIDYEHSMLLTYPTEWKRQPLMVKISSIFTENPLALHAGDNFPGKFTFVISTPGQQNYSLKEVAQLAETSGISVEELEEELGIKFSEQTESLQVPLERMLSLFGAEGKTRREQIYSINYQIISELFTIISKDVELVDGIESLLLECEIEQLIGETLVFFLIITYVEKSNMIFTFNFIDNTSDRSKIDLVRKQVLSSVKFWTPST